MNKYLFIKYIISFVIFISVWAICIAFFPQIDRLYKILISSVLMVIGTPSFKKIDFLSGEKTQIKWLFFKKVIIQ